jgi:hypothetical protein
MASYVDMPEFARIEDAIAAGWRRPGAKDIDVSGGQSYGYVFVDSDDGARSVTVYLSREPNKIGGTGAYLSMFPPKGAIG